jgi:acyl-CoA thioesterase-1
LPSAAPTQTIVFIGDSLTQGYGVRKQEAFPDRVQELLRARGRFVTAINGGISGSRSADADRRLLWYLKLNPKPVMVVLALGSNDALSGTRVDVIQDHLAKAIRVAKAEHLKVLLCGVQVYTNFGQDYNKALAQMFQSLARAEKVELMPFLLEGVAMNKELNQADQKHPNARGHEIIAHHLADRIDKILFSKRQK